MNGYSKSGYSEGKAGSIGQLERFSPSEPNAARLSGPKVATVMHNAMSETISLAERVNALANALLGPLPEATDSVASPNAGDNVVDRLLSHGNDVERALHRANRALARIDESFL